MRMTPIGPFQHIAKLRRGERHRVAGGRTQHEATAVEPLGVERHAEPIMPQNLDQIVAAAPENVEIAAMRIALEAMLHLEHQPMHAAPHVGVAACNAHAGRAGYGNHAPSERRTAVISLGSASAAIRITAPLISITSAAAGGRSPCGRNLGGLPGCHRHRRKISHALGREPLAPAIDLARRHIGRTRDFGRHRARRERRLDQRPLAQIAPAPPPLRSRKHLDLTRRSVANTSADSDICASATSPTPPNRSRWAPSEGRFQSAGCR